MLNAELTFYLTAVEAQVDKYAEIEYSMVSSPTVSKSSIDLSLKVKKWTSSVNAHFTIWTVCVVRSNSFFLHLSPLFLVGGILQHREASGASILPNSLLSPPSGQQHAIYGYVCLHRKLCSVRLRQSWSPQPLRHWWHGELHAQFFNLRNLISCR